MDSDRLYINHDLALPLDEVAFRFSRSGGPGGQNVNRTATRVELLFDVAGSPSLNEEQRRLLQERLAHLLDGAGMLRVTSQDSPSQWRNRQAALERFQALLAQALRRQPARVPTRPTLAARRARLHAKRRRSQTKLRRRRPSPDEE